MKTTPYTTDDIKEQRQNATVYLRKLFLQKLVAVLGIVSPFLMYHVGDGTGVVLSLLFLPCFVRLLFCKNIVND